MQYFYLKEHFTKVKTNKQNSIYSCLEAGCSDFCLSSNVIEPDGTKVKERKEGIINKFKKHNICFQKWRFGKLLGYLMHSILKIQYLDRIFAYVETRNSIGSCTESTKRSQAMWRCTETSPPVRAQAGFHEPHQAAAQTLFTLQAGDSANYMITL